MKSNRIFFLLPVILVMFGCGGGGGSSRTLVSIAVAPANPSIALGTTQQFSATGTFSDNSTQDISSTVTWKSSDTGVATINATGLATSVATGQTAITAASGNITSNSSTLTVTAATLRSVAVTPANPVINIGASQKFTATGTFSDNSTQDLTSLVSWSSSNTTVATISITGSATAAATGSATITATAPPSLGSKAGSATLTVPVPPPPAVPAAANVLSVTVNGSLCTNYPGIYYPNKPCVQVTVCEPGTSNCQTIKDILLDTGSYGLRIFKSALGTLSLPQATVPSGNLAECIQYVDNSADWGPVQTADVVLGGEPAVTIPIQVIDSTFGTVPSGCVPTGGALDTSPSSTGFNGILGVGLFVEDCGPGCAPLTGGAANNQYFACSGSTCTGTTVPLNSQVQNPVANLPTDNNGVLVQLPAVPLAGAASDNGQLVLGIGTQTNNTLSGVTTYPATPSTNLSPGPGYFTTVFNNITYNSSFIDSGSNALYFSANLPVSNGWYIPTSITTLSAVNKGYTGLPSGTVQFQIGNANTLFGSGNSVFSDLGGNLSVPGFDWGLPFFLGRSVFVGIEPSQQLPQTPSPLGTGPYWAY